MKPSRQPSNQQRIESKARMVVNQLVGPLREGEEEFERPRPLKQWGPRHGGPGSGPGDSAGPMGDVGAGPEGLEGPEGLDNPGEERTEVDIAREMLSALDCQDSPEACLDQVRALAQELLDMHGEGDDAELGGDDLPPAGDLPSSDDDIDAPPAPPTDDERA